MITHDANYDEKISLGYLSGGKIFGDKEFCCSSDQWDETVLAYDNFEGNILRCAVDQQKLNEFAVKKDEHGLLMLQLAQKVSEDAEFNRWFPNPALFDNFIEETICGVKCGAWIDVLSPYKENERPIALGALICDDVDAPVSPVALGRYAFASKLLLSRNGLIPLIVLVLCDVRNIKVRTVALTERDFIDLLFKVDERILEFALFLHDQNKWAEVSGQ
ncbi:MAG: hypothetical protein LBP75_02760 [Planctomycetota bacterium]|jgi:hypothetical protein|nr:hypothetical protein [Planctomycetota bacterium]